MSKKAVLVVSFGTSYVETRKRTIDAIEADVQAAFPEAKLYRAWGSKFILRKLKERDGVHYDNVAEAMVRMKKDGITDVIVQPTYIINGNEYDWMVEAVEAARADFDSVKIGKPLLCDDKDIREIVDVLYEIFADVADDTMIVLMGHGTEHDANGIYERIGQLFAADAKKKMIMGTVEAAPDIDDVLQLLKESGVKKALLSPFMVVAGDHANNDLAGDEPDSWKSLIEAEGIQTQCLLKGLGEYPEVRRIFIRHANEAM